MQQIILPATDLSVSRFVFGTASLFNAGSAAKRAALLEAAVDAGFTHFDTAPYYGFGAAERDMAAMLRRHPHVTVTTKAGIYSPGGEDRADAAIFLRKAAGRFLPALSRPTHDWHVARARNCLEGSLRRLGRDHVDMFMLHEPDLATLPSDEWQRWLEDEVRSGRVRHFGIAVDAARLRPFLTEETRLTTVIQTIDSLERREADAVLATNRPLQITFGYVSAALQSGAPVDVPTVLKAALARNASGAVVVSTRRPERLGLYRTLAPA